MKAFYRKISPIGFAVVGGLCLYLAYENHRLYRITPSIPFRPHCVIEEGRGDIVPVKGDIEITKEFLDVAVKNLSYLGATMHIQYQILENHEYVDNPTPLLLSPESFENSQNMMFATRQAFHVTRGIPTYFDQTDGAPSLECKDIEGIITKF
jgi:hypothetical protein